MKINQRLLNGAAATLLLILSPVGCSRASKVEGKLSTAKEYFNKSNYPAAEIEFKNVLAAQPGQPDALRGLGLIYLRQGVALDAFQMLSAAQQKLPKDDELCVGLARALLELGFVPASRKALLEVLDRVPSHGEALLLFAETSSKPEELAECEKRIARAKADDKALVLLASALVELRRNQLDSGATLVARALAADPKCTPALVLQGNLLRARKQPEQALEPLKKAADLAGPRSTETAAYARLLVALDRKGEAVALLKKATVAAPDYLPNWRLLGQLSFAEKNDDEATGYLAKVLAKSPLDLEAGVLQSQIWIRQQKPARAVELIEKLSKAFPPSPQLLLPLAKACLAAGDFRKAADALDRGLLLDPGKADAVLLRSGIHLKEGKPAEAIRALEALLVAEPANRMAQDLLAQAYRAANRGADATAILKTQTATAPGDPALQLRLGQLLVTQGNLVEARTAFERALELAPNELACVSQLVSIDQHEGKTREAMARVDAYLTTHPKLAQAHLLKASLCFIQKDLKTAESFAIKTLELDPQDPSAYSMLVRIQIADGRAEEAVGRMKERLKSAPKDLPVRMQLATLLQFLGRLDEARANLAEIIQIAPDFAAAYNDLACLDAEVAGKLEIALGNARKARALAPRTASIADTLGWIEWRSGNYSEALPLLQEAASALPQIATVQYHLAMGHYMMHQIQEASDLLEKSLALQDGLVAAEKSEAGRRLAILRDGGALDLPALEQQLKDDPKDVVLCILLGKKLAAAGRPEEALAGYRKALAVNPKVEAAYLGEAELYAAALNQPAKALEAANQARKVAPQSPRAAAALGAANFRHGNYPQAHALLQEAIAKLPEDPRILADYGWAAYSQGRVGAARASLGKLDESDPARGAEARDLLALTAPNAAADPATPGLVEKCLASNPGFVPALMARAALQEKAGESPLPTYVKVLEVFPQFDPARLALARVYLDDPAKLDEAEKLATAAREQLRDDPELSAVLALVSFRKGKFDYAAQLLKELSGKRPLNGRELFALGMSQAATHELDAARQALTQALQTQLPDADAAKAKATLEELSKTTAEK